MKDILRAFILVLIALVLLLLLRCGAAVQRGRGLELTPVPLPQGTATLTATPRPPTRVPTPRPRRATPVPTPAPRAALPTPRPTELPHGLAAIQGQVRHYKPGTPDVVPYPEAHVLAYAGGRMVTRTVTDSTGTFNLTGLADGSYTLQVLVPTSYPFNSSALQIFGGRSLYGQSILLEEEFEPDTVTVSFQAGLTDAQMDAVVAQYGGLIKQRIPDKNKYGVKIPAGSSVPDFVAKLKTDRRVLGATPNYYITWRR